MTEEERDIEFERDLKKRVEEIEWSERESSKIKKKERERRKQSISYRVREIQRRMRGKERKERVSVLLRDLNSALLRDYLKSLRLSSVIPSIFQTR